MQEFDKLEDDMRLLALALARTLTDSGKRHDLDDVIAGLGVDMTDPDD